MDALERVGRVPRDRLPGLDVAGERDEPDRRDACTSAVADRDAVACDHVEARPAGAPPARARTKPERRQRRLLGGLEDLDVAGRERRPQLPDGHHQRVVPGRDPRDDPERLAPDDRRVALDVLAGGLALERARGAGEEAEVVGRERHLVAARSTSACRRSATRAASAPPRARRSGRRASAAARSGPSASSSTSPPSAFFGRLDRALDVRGGAARHLGDRLAGRRVQHLHRLAAGDSTHSPPTKFLYCVTDTLIDVLPLAGAAGEPSPAPLAPRYRRPVQPPGEDPRRRHGRRRLRVRRDRAAARPLRPRHARRRRPARRRPRSSSASASPTASRPHASTPPSRSSVRRAHPRARARRGAQRRRPALQPADLRGVPRGAGHLPRHGDDALGAAPRAAVRGDGRQARRPPVRARRGLARGGAARARRAWASSPARPTSSPATRPTTCSRRSTRSASATARTSSSRATTSRRRSRSGRRSRSASTRR